jgi:AbrB family looped-hinge helix DNA binding protein
MADEALQEVEYLTTTRLGEKGQVTIPKEYRDALGLEPGSPIAVVRVGPGLMLFGEQVRFRELCERLSDLIGSGGSAEGGLLGGVAAVIANQEKIIANQEKIIANQGKIISNTEKNKAK